MKIEEIMARAVAGHYGPIFEDCPVDRKDYDAMFIRGKVSGDTSSQDEHIDAAKSAITALEKAGYAVVPVEPTDEMLSAGMSANVGPRISAHGYIYDAMIQQAKNDM